jgi:uncharacterized protein (TIGR03437 family)
MIAGGKEGNIYVIDRSQLGHMEGLDASVIHKFSVARLAKSKSIGHAQEGPSVGFGLFNFAFWPSSEGSYLFLRTYYDVLRAFRMNSDGSFETVSSSAANVVSLRPLDGLTVSSNGANADSGIVWQTSYDVDAHPSSGVLHAFLATDLSQELWNSAMMPLRDGYGVFSKFCNPTVANGKVYVGTRSGQLVVYGSLPRQEPGTVRTVLNGASGLSGPIAPGEVVDIVGTSVGQPQGDAGPEVFFDNAPASVLNADSNQITVIVPDQLSGSGQTSIQVKNGDSLSTPFINTVAAAAPGIFTIDGTGIGQCFCVNADTSSNGAGQPASRGDVISFYATGLGFTDAAIRDGNGAHRSPRPSSGLLLTIGGKRARVLLTSAAPDIPGAIRIDAVVPQGMMPNVAAPIVLTIGNASSWSKATLAVQ